MTVQTPTQTTRRGRRLAEGTGFVAVWIALGYLLPIDTDAYLLLGIPLAVAFQLLVRRRPLREVWMRDGDRRFRLDRAGLALAVLLVVTPVLLMVDAVASGTWTMIAWAVAAIAGAFPAAWALRSTGPVATLRAALPTLLVGIPLLALIGGVPLFLSGRPIDPLAMLGHAAYWALLYLPVGFILEEVAFRGVLDAHVQRPGERRGPGTALLVSVLWGLWHLPVSPPGQPIWLTAISLVVVSVLIGIPMSYAWRRTGSLAPSSLAHAVYNGIRNALQA
ncbi:CPBP family intramembrane glutamic endopeptidase [Pseudonocardia sp. KRD291]|uniref:CPBP family intramembrane glutamic endopeptidase n=1 Tax=Pseudonocardia sp. KRD291 TaxID=2792007 RepID=UPI001C4A4385|nr:CPBP family intramembrane glutamic endopeptidase [Pseudonocardia sp. KRD291]MBW0105099.1 CPBP family intramembrane metalloprotease [Pseudonocardia sp. KRD291]